MGCQTEQECLTYWLLNSWETSLEFGKRGKARCSRGWLGLLGASGSWAGPGQP